jgi:hypothetical protein
MEGSAGFPARYCSAVKSNWAARLVDITVMQSSADGYLELSGATIARILDDLTVLTE